MLRGLGTGMLPVALLGMWLCATSLTAQERMAPIPAEKMNDAQRKSAAAFSAVRTTPPTGPFAVMLRVPELMDLTFQWREHVQFRNVLDQRQAEFIILMAARHWTQQYDVEQPRAAPAIKAGLHARHCRCRDRRGRRPRRWRKTRLCSYNLCASCCTTKSVSDATYAARAGQRSASPASWRPPPGRLLLRCWRWS